ncbi:MAG TPA: SHOCT domain-containing protein [Herpetosiphonaceae bacterium]
MSIAEEIEKLQVLHAQGALTDAEFSQAKATLLDRLSSEQPAAYSSELNQEMQYLRLQNEINQLDRDWDRERETYMVRGRYGSRYIPSEGTSLLGGIAIVGFGLFWTISTLEMGAPGFFPLFGVIFIIFGAVTSFISYGKAGAYKEAEQRYQERRRQLASHRSSGSQEW